MVRKKAHISSSRCLTLKQKGIESVNQYKLDRYEGAYAILVEESEFKNELSVLRERLSFVKPGDYVEIEFDSIGNLKHVAILSKCDKMEKA